MNLPNLNNPIIAASKNAIGIPIPLSIRAASDPTIAAVFAAVFTAVFVTTYVTVYVDILYR